MNFSQTICLHDERQVSATQVSIDHPVKILRTAVVKENIYAKDCACKALKTL